MRHINSEPGSIQECTISEQGPHAEYVVVRTSGSKLTRVFQIHKMLFVSYANFKDDDSE